MLRAGQPGIRVATASRENNFFLLQSFKTGSGTHPVYYAIKYPKGPPPDVKCQIWEADSASSQCQNLEWVVL